MADRTKKMGASAIREIYASKPDLRAGRYSLSENCRYSPKVQQHKNIRASVEEIIVASGSQGVLDALGKVLISPEQPAAAPAIGPNPSKGLSAFYEEDADRFFGREALIQRLWEKFRDLHLAKARVTPAAASA